MTNSRKSIFVALVVVVAGSVAMAVMLRRPELPPTPFLIVTPALELLDGPEHGSGDFAVGRSSADKRLMLSVRGDLTKNCRKPGTYWYAVSTEKSIPIAPKAQVLWQQLGAAGPASRHSKIYYQATWEGVAGDVYLTVPERTDAAPEPSGEPAANSDSSGSRAQTRFVFSDEHPAYSASVRVEGLVLRRIGTGEERRLAPFTIEATMLGGKQIPYCVVPIQPPPAR